MAKMTYGFIGAGNMGGIIAVALATKTTCRVNILEHHPEKICDMQENFADDLQEKGSAIASADLVEVAQSDCIVLAVKPKALPKVLAELAPFFAERVRGGDADFCVVSMAAGVRLEKIKEWLGFDVPAIRIMPNTPVKVGQGIVGYVTSGLESGKGKTAGDAFLAGLMQVSALVPVEEKDMDAICALSGSGPAFCYMFIGALAAGGEACGLSPSAARFLAAQTAHGAAVMVEDSVLSTRELTERVCSPNGTTVQGVEVLRNACMEEQVKQAVIAAYNRSLELSRD